MMSMYKKNSQIEQIENVMVYNKLFERFNLNRIGIFGSAARGEQSNDIDLIIEENIDYRILSAFRDELQKLLNKKIDIIIAKYANPIILHRAMKEIVYVTNH